MKVGKRCPDPVGRMGVRMQPPRASVQMALKPRVQPTVRCYELVDRTAIFLSLWSCFLLTSLADPEIPHLSPHPLTAFPPQLILPPPQSYPGPIFTHNGHELENHPPRYEAGPGKELDMLAGALQPINSPGLIDSRPRGRCSRPEPMLPPSPT